MISGLSNNHIDVKLVLTDLTFVVIIMKKVFGLLTILLMLAMPVMVSADTSMVSSILTKATIPEGYYALKPKCNPARALSIKGYSASAYATTVSHSWTKNKAQIFYISPSTNGSYRIQCYKSGMTLSVKDASTKEGATVRQSSWSSLNSQRWYFLKHGNYYLIQSSISKRCLTVKNSSTANNAKVYMHEYHYHMPGENWRLVRINIKNTQTVERVNENRIYKTTVNGKKTLKSYLQNAMVPCGRTLYIWGGGWGGIGTDTAIIGYQNEWQSFFNENGTSSYDYTKYRYDYGKGLDCSGFAAWTLYNTLYSSPGKVNLVTQSTTVASTYTKKGWTKLAENGKDKTFKPGDVVSMSGHVWISLGQYSDGSVLLVHSSPKGVQISGTKGTAYTKAKYYMQKYFPEWPYEARQVSDSYLNYVGKARWITSGSGSVMKDPDGIQKMSANQVMKLLFGS